MPPERFRVLIVDDEADIGESIGMILESLVPTVELVNAVDGKDALAKMDALDGDPPVDLILSDYKMPNMDGIEFLHIVRKRYPDVPRLMLTAYPDPQLAVKAVREAGVGLFVAKPFDPEYVGQILQAFAPHD